MNKEVQNYNMSSQVHIDKFRQVEFTLSNESQFTVLKLTCGQGLLLKLQFSSQLHFVLVVDSHSPWTLNARFNVERESNFSHLWYLPT